MPQYRITSDKPRFRPVVVAAPACDIACKQFEQGFFESRLGDTTTYTGRLTGHCYKVTKLTNSPKLSNVAIYPLLQVSEYSHA